MNFLLLAPARQVFLPLINFLLAPPQRCNLQRANARVVDRQMEEERPEARFEGIVPASPLEKKGPGGGASGGLSDSTWKIFKY